MKLLLLLLLLPTVCAMDLIVTSQLNRTVEIQQGSMKATVATFQINNTENYSKEAIVFFRTRNPAIVTVGEVVEDARTMRVPFGVMNISEGILGVTLGSTYIDYGVITDVRPPFITEGYPYGKVPIGTRTVNLSVYTDLSDSLCRYDVLPKLYRNMQNQFFDNYSEHTATLNGLRDNTSYQYYVSCWRPINESQINQSSFLVNVTCPRVGWCGDGVPSIWNETSLNYTNENDIAYVINFTVGNVYPAPIPKPIPEPAKPIVIYVEPINITPVMPKIVNLTNLSSNNVTIPQKIEINVSKTNISSNISEPIRSYPIGNRTNTTAVSTIEPTKVHQKTGEFVAGLFFCGLLLMLIVDLIAYVVAKRDENLYK